MKRLILMRHAKSDWSNGGTTDHDRPLNPRGKRAAALVGGWLRNQGIRPDQVLCSSAERTSETLMLLDLDGDTETTFSGDLYLATPARIMAALKDATGDVVLMVTHNPGIAEMAEQILITAPDHPKFGQYPSGATLVADLAIDNWAEATWGNAIARHFIVPRDLEP